VTRKIAQSSKYAVIMALLILMVIQIDPAVAENTAQNDLNDFGDLLDGVAAKVSVNTIQYENISVQTPIPYAVLLVQQITYLQAFEEIIQDNILKITKSFHRGN